MDAQRVPIAPTGRPAPDPTPRPIGRPATAPGSSRRPARLTGLTTLVVALAGLVGALLVAVVPTMAAAAPTVRVMPLGDSITGSPGCWRQALWTRLQSSGYSNVDFVGSLDNSQSCGSTFDGQNEGHGGFLARDILANNQLPGWLSSARPDVVMLQLATNDVWNNIPTQTILNTFASLIAQMRAQNPSMRVVVAQITPMNPSGCSACGQRVIALDAAIPAWAAGISTTASPVSVVDLWTGYSTATDTTDGVHPASSPTSSGNQKIAKAWYPALTAAVDWVVNHKTGTTQPPPTTTRPPVTTTRPPVTTTPPPVTTTRPPVTTTRPPVTTTPPVSTTHPPVTTAVPTTPATTTPTGPAGSAGCTATVSVTNEWQGGFVAAVRVTAGTRAISGWTVQLAIPAGTSITNLWNGARTGQSVANVAWNGQVSFGQTVEFGFQGAGASAGLSVASCSAA